MKIPKIDVAAQSEGTVLLTVEPPMKSSRNGMDICAVIDVSGSMQVEAKMKDEKGDLEKHGLSILDVVKHTVKTIINTMNENDRFSIVTFSTEAKLVFSLLKMNEAGRKRALRELNKLDVETQTNLWGGLNSGMEVLRKSKKAKNQQHLLLFTDGLPNVKPPKGELKMLEGYKKKNADMEATLHFFGFGYDLDSELLENLSKAGGGMYNYIPDSSFCGTIFVNAIANIFSSFSTRSILEIETLNGASIDCAVGEYEVEEMEENKYLVNPGMLQVGQRKSIILKVDHLPKDKAFMNVKLLYRLPTRQDRFEVSLTDICVEESSKRKDIEMNYLRLKVVEALRKALHFAQNRNDLKSAQNEIDEMMKLCKNSSVKNTKYVKDLVKDMNGQVSLSLSRREWMDKWGVHYLRSLLGAHNSQLCNNFKDPGVQHYGGKMFEKIQGEGEDIFSKMKPPKAKPMKNPFAGTAMSHLWRPQNNPQPVQRNFSMRRYYNVGGGCIHGQCSVKMSDGTSKLVKNLRQGDRVMTGQKKSATVKCVVQTISSSGKFRMCHVSKGLTLTPYHPVKIDGKWTFPVNLVEDKEMEVSEVYDFVLDKNHTLVIDGLQVVSFGHNLKGGVVEHEYFGSDKIIDDLKEMKGWKKGFIKLSNNALLRDRKSMLVVGIDKRKEIMVC